MDRITTRAASDRQTLEDPLTATPGRGMASTTVAIRVGAPDWDWLIVSAVFVQPPLSTLRARIDRVS